MARIHGADTWQGGAGQPPHWHSPRGAPGRGRHCGRRRSWRARGRHASSRVVWPARRPLTDATTRTRTRTRRQTCPGPGHSPRRTSSSVPRSPQAQGGAPLGPAVPSPLPAGVPTATAVQQRADRQRPHPIQCRHAPLRAPHLRALSPAPPAAPPLAPESARPSSSCRPVYPFRTSMKRPWPPTDRPLTIRGGVGYGAGTNPCPNLVRYGKSLDRFRTRCRGCHFGVYGGSHGDVAKW